MRLRWAHLPTGSSQLWVDIGSWHALSAGSRRPCTKAWTCTICELTTPLCKAMDLHTVRRSWLRVWIRAARSQISGIACCKWRSTGPLMPALSSGALGMHHGLHYWAGGRWRFTMPTIGLANTKTCSHQHSLARLANTKACSLQLSLASSTAELNHAAR